MTESKEGQQTEFILKVVSVKMKIKFPCRMALEYNKQLITREVSSVQGNKFIFNDEITLKGDGDTQNYEIMVNLYTDKGTRYTSGIIKLIGGELSRSQGERLIIPIAKCLDPDAFSEIKVQQINSLSRSLLRMSKSNSRLFNSGEKPQGFISDPKRISSDRYLIAQTRSEVHSPPAPSLPISDQGRGREPARSQILKTFTKSPNSKYSSIKFLGISNQLKNMSEFPVEEVTSQRQTFAESEVIREGYQKLKQKYKKQSELAKEETHKRMLLEANQNNYKLEIVKLKLKCQGQQKEISDKNEKIKLINQQLNELQKKDTDIAYLKAQSSALQNKVKIQEDTLQCLNNENQSLKKLMNDKQKSKDETISQLRHELEFATVKIEEQKHELELQVKTKDAIISGKNKDLSLREETIDRQKKMIKELQDQAELKLFQFEKSVTAQRTALQRQIDQIKQKNSLLAKQKAQLKLTIVSLQEDLEKQRSSYIALQYSKKLLYDQTIALNKQIDALKSVKEKYSELQKEHKFLEEQFAAVRKSLELSLQNKQVNINDLLSKYEENKGRYEKTRAENQEKIKNLAIKIQELEIKAENSKSLIQKNNRTIQNLTKEIAACKGQNANLRAQLKAAEKKIITLEGDHSTNYSKYQRETASFKFLLEKYKDERQALEKENDNLKEKVQKLEEVNHQYERKESGWKLRERHYQQKIQNDNLKHKQAVYKHQAIKNELETTIAEHNLRIESLAAQVTQQRKKINEYELTEIRTREKQQRFKKQAKFNEEKIASLEAQLKARLEDSLVQADKYRELEFKITERDVEISKSKEELVQERNKHTKQMQISEMLGKDIAKLNSMTAELQSGLNAKEELQGQLRNTLKDARDEVAKQKIRSNKIEADFEKFKESINDVIKIQFTRILATPNPQKFVERIRESQVSVSRSERSDKSRLKSSLDAGQLVSTLTEKLHETKNSLWKMAQLNRAFKGQNLKLAEQVQSASNKHEFEKLEYHRDIQQLEDEMNLIIDDKEAEVQNYDNLVIDLNAKIKEKELLIEQMRTEIDECNAIITGLRTDFDTNNDLNDKKVISLKATITEMNGMIQYLNLNVACAEDKNHQMQEKIFELENEIISLKELLMRNEKTLIDCKESQTKISKTLEDLRKEHKALQENNEELEIQLNTESEVKQKYMSLLEEEQKKAQKLSEFIASLIVQKETAMKNQIERSEQVNSLENQLFESSQANEILKEDSQALRKKNNELKEQIKVLSKTNKTLEKQLSEERTKYGKSIQKIKQRDTDIEIKKEYIKDLEQKYREMRDKNYKEIKQLSNQLQDKNASSFSMSKELTEKLIKIESQNKKLWEQKVFLKAELQAMSHQLHNKDDAIEDLVLKLKKNDEEKMNLEDEIASKEFIIHERVEEIKRLEEVIEEQRVSLHTINGEFQTYQKQFDININQLTNDYNFKLQTLEKQFDQKLELERKESQFVRHKIESLEQQLNRTLLEKKSQEIDHEQTKRIYQDKLKKLENQRLQAILSKNNEIKQLGEENKVNLLKMHEKESQLRKASLQLQQLKLSTGRSQEYHTYSLEQSKNRSKVLEKEIEGLRAKQQLGTSFKQSLLSALYQNEVEVRKILASTATKIIETCNKKDFDKIVLLLKGLESNVVQAMMGKIDSL